jgi:hypothetical protein
MSDEQTPVSELVSTYNFIVKLQGSFSLEETPDFKSRNPIKTLDEYMLKSGEVDLFRLLQAFAIPPTWFWSPDSGPREPLFGTDERLIRWDKTFMVEENLIKWWAEGYPLLMEKKSPEEGSFPPFMSRYVAYLREAIRFEMEPSYWQWAAWTRYIIAQLCNHFAKTVMFVNDGVSATLVSFPIHLASHCSNLGLFARNKPDQLSIHNKIPEVTASLKEKVKMFLYETGIQSFLIVNTAAEYTPIIQGFWEDRREAINLVVQDLKASAMNNGSGVHDIIKAITDAERISDEDIYRIGKIFGSILNEVVRENTSNLLWKRYQGQHGPMPNFPAYPKPDVRLTNPNCRNIDAYKQWLERDQKYPDAHQEWYGKFFGSIVLPFLHSIYSKEFLVSIDPTYYQVNTELLQETEGIQWATYRWVHGEVVETPLSVDDIQSIWETLTFPFTTLTRRNWDVFRHLSSLNNNRNSNVERQKPY